MGKILITTGCLDFGVVPSGKVPLPKSSPGPASKHIASAQLNGADASKNNVQMLTLLNASFSQQSVTTVQVRFQSVSQNEARIIIWSGFEQGVLIKIRKLEYISWGDTLDSGDIFSHQR